MTAGWDALIHCPPPPHVVFTWLVQFGGLWQASELGGVLGPDVSGREVVCPPKLHGVGVAWPGSSLGLLPPGHVLFCCLPSLLLRGPLREDFLMILPPSGHLKSNNIKAKIITLGTHGSPQAPSSLPCICNMFHLPSLPG